LSCCTPLLLHRLQDDVPIPVVITAYEDKTFTWIMKTPPATYFIKQAAGIKSAAQKPGHQSAASISLKHLHEIARVKQKDTPLVSLQSVVTNLIGTCRSMGVKVVSRPEDAA
jgi:large subunit ribosomal protein L11